MLRWLALLLSDTSLCGTMHFDFFFLFISLICKMGVILSYLATLFYFCLWKRPGSSEHENPGIGCHIDSVLMYVF